MRGKIGKEIGKIGHLHVVRHDRGRGARPRSYGNAETNFTNFLERPPQDKARRGPGSALEKAIAVLRTARFGLLQDAETDVRIRVVSDDLPADNDVAWYSVVVVGRGIGLRADP